MRATKKLGNKGLPVVHSWLEIRICVKNIVSSTSTWLEFVSQAAIFMGPVGAILLGNGSRWGFVLGLATQPFWFYTSFRHRQWGIFIASIFYALGWAIGVYRNF